MTKEPNWTVMVIHINLPNVQHNSFVILCFLLLPPDGDATPNTEPAAAAAGGAAAAEPSTSQPQKTEETGEKTADQPDEPKVHG